MISFLQYNALIIKCNAPVLSILSHLSRGIERGSKKRGYVYPHKLMLYCTFVVRRRYGAYMVHIIIPCEYCSPNSYCAKYLASAPDGVHATMPSSAKTTSAQKASSYSTSPPSDTTPSKAWAPSPGKRASASSIISTSKRMNSNESRILPPRPSRQ